MRAKTAGLLALATLTILHPPQTSAPSAVAAATFPNDEKTIIHVLNRIGYGPRAGDVAAVQKMGLQAYIEQQLYPDRIPDAAMDARLARFTTLNLSNREISEQYEQPQQEQKRLRQQQQAARGANPANPDRPADPNAAPDPTMRRQQQLAARGQLPGGAQNLTPQQRLALQQAGGPQQAAIMNELSEQKMLRAVYSERQLQEVLTDFWFNHFNVDAKKGRDRYLLTSYERDVIRPNVLGKFRDLLGATAKSPAMLFYLDNFQSVDPNAAANNMGRGRGLQPGIQGRPGARGRFGAGIQIPLPRPPQAQAKNAPRGLNENYGRELMELHTLGVDGGYTQKDVTEVARAFTGWSIDNPRMGAGFIFQPRMHDEREKIVLGHKINAGGMKDGEEVLDILASHPSTAKFIATKLTRRFVADTPPPSLVDRVAARFTETNGDLREVMRTILTSPEFLGANAYRAKVKTPLEFVASSVRALGTDVVNGMPLVRAMADLGMPLYQCQPPTGYKDTADAWTNTGALVERMNFAQTLATNQLAMPGAGRAGQNALQRPNAANRPNAAVRPNAGRAARGRAAVGAPQFAPQTPTVDRDTLIANALGNDISESTRATIAKATTTPQMIALTLGSPEFQRR